MGTNLPKFVPNQFEKVFLPYYQKCSSFTFDGLPFLCKDIKNQFENQI